MVPSSLSYAVPVSTGEPISAEIHGGEITDTTVAAEQVPAAALALYAIYLLWSLLLLVFLALFLAVTLHAFVDWLNVKGLPHWGSLSLIIGGLLVSIIVGMALVLPALIDQVALFGHHLPNLRDQVLNQFTAGSVIRHQLEHAMDSADWTQASTWLVQFLAAGGIALGGLSETALLLVIALYLLIDGSKTFEWFLAFFSPLKRRKLRITGDEVSQVIFGYVAGQALNSLLVMIYAYIVLSLLHVPAALMLAILAGAFDVLPILGVIISTIPACLLALSVSPKTALIVLGLYLLFHVVEIYVIVPKVYGKNLRVSTLTVLLGLLAGAMLAGIPGALAALPVIASYAAIERIWLKPFLRDGVSEKHEQLKDQEFGEKA